MAVSLAIQHWRIFVCMSKAKILAVSLAGLLQLLNVPDLVWEDITSLQQIF